MGKKWVDIDEVVKASDEKDYNKEIADTMKSIPKGERAK